MADLPKVNEVFTCEHDNAPGESWDVLVVAVDTAEGLWTVMDIETEALDLMVFDENGNWSLVDISIEAKD